MIIKCAWCGKDLGEKEPKNDKSLSHGICQECKRKALESIPRKNPMRMFQRNSFAFEKLTQDEVEQVLRSTAKAVGGKGQYYLGRKVKNKNPWTEWRLFKTVEIPTFAKYKKLYVIVIGPFGSEKQAVIGFYQHHTFTKLKSVLRKGKRIVATYGINE